MKQVICILLVTAAAGQIFAGGSPSRDEQTVTLGYNPFLSDSFTDAPPPIDVIREELARTYPDITLEYRTMPADMLNSLVVWMTSRDDAVDIYGIDVPWVSQFGRAGWTVPLEDHLPQLKEDFASGGLETFSYEGSIIAVPFWNSVTGLFYRTDLLEKYGYQPPATLDELTAAAVSIQRQEEGVTGFLWPGARDESLVMFYSTLLHAFGGRYQDDQGTYQFNSPASRQAISFMMETIETGITPKAAVGWERMEIRPRFTEGNAVLLWDNADMITWLDDPDRSGIAGNWDFIPFPAQEGGRPVSISGGFAFALNPYSSSKESALQVLEVIAGKTVQKGFALAWGPVQHYQGLYDDPVVQQYNPNAHKLIPILDIAVSRPPSRTYAELSSMLQEEIHGAVSGVRGIEQVLENMERRTEVIERR